MCVRLGRGFIRAFHHRESVKYLFVCVSDSRTVGMTFFGLVRMYAARSVFGYVRFCVLVAAWRPFVAKCMQEKLRRESLVLMRCHDLETP